MKRLSGDSKAAVRLWAALMWAAVLLLSPRGALASEAVVEEVRVAGLYSMDEEELLYLLEIREGEPIQAVSLRRGLKRAFLKGIFENIEVERDEARPGLILVKVKERDFISDIKVDGAGNTGNSFIRRELGLSDGDEMRYDLLDSYREKVLDVLWQKGYPYAEASVEVQKTRRPHRVRLAFEIKEGSPTRIKEIVALGRPAPEVLSVIKTSEGSVFDQYRLREDIERLTGYYLKKGYLNPVAGPFTFSDGVLHLSVEPGMRLEIKFKGNDAISGKKLMRVMPFADARDVRDDLIDEAVARMTSAYHSMGYATVQIATVMSTEGDTTTLNFFIYEGPRVKVESISLEGVTIPEESLKGVIALREGGLYNPDLLGNDAQALRDFYNALGYLDAEVSEPEAEVEGSSARVVMRVREGRQYKITGIGMEGVASVPEDELAHGLHIVPGAPYNEVDISDARRSIIGLYRERGYHEADVRVRREFDGEGGIRVVFEVEEGPMLHFGKTVVRGNDSTKLDVVTRELDHKEGDPLNKAVMLRERQRIFKTGLFSRADMDLMERYDHKSDVLLDLEEGKAGTVEFGAGYGEYDRLRGFLDVSYKNLFGMNRLGAARVEAGSLMRRYILRYNEPWFLGRRTPMRAYFIKEDRKEINIDTGDVRYRVERYTAGVGVEKELSDRVKFDLLYEYSLTDTFDVAPDIILSKEDTGTLGISSITPSLTFDSRDNPFDPKRGLYAGASIKTATVLLLSETDFFKLEGFASVYRELARNVVLAANVRGGMAQGMRDTTDLPLVERFFLGGRSTVRGFPQDGLGPKGPQGNPIGGNLFFQGNLELRLGIKKNWRIVPFFDTGQVWLDDEDVDFSELRYTAGLGLQYNTPVGPIRLDYGRKLDRRAGESSGEIHFSIGHAF